MSPSSSHRSGTPAASGESLRTVRAVPAGCRFAGAPRRSAPLGHREVRGAAPCTARRVQVLAAKCAANWVLLWHPVALSEVVLRNYAKDLLYTMSLDWKSHHIRCGKWTCLEKMLLVSLGGHWRHKALSTSRMVKLSQVCCTPIISFSTSPSAARCSGAAAGEMLQRSLGDEEVAQRLLPLFRQEWESVCSSSEAEFFPRGCVSYWGSYFKYRKSCVCAFSSLGAGAAAGCAWELGCWCRAAAVCPWELGQWRRCGRRHLAAGAATNVFLLSLA